MKKNLSLLLAGVPLFTQVHAQTIERPNIIFILTDAPTLPHTLKKGGYATGHFGKWHLGGGRDVYKGKSVGMEKVIACPA